MELKLVLECKIIKYLEFSGNKKRKKWLQPKQLLRLVYDKDTYSGFPMSVKKVEYLDDTYRYVKVEASVLTDKDYMDYLSTTKKFILAHGITFLGECWIKKIG